MGLALLTPLHLRPQGWAPASLLPGDAQLQGCSTRLSGYFQFEGAGSSPASASARPTSSQETPGLTPQQGPGHRKCGGILADYPVLVKRT